MTVCSRCGLEPPAGSRFCSSCGTPLRTEGAPEHQERKVVSVVFADLVGFTARSEQLDPEDVRALLRPYHQQLRTELERYGGTVEKFIGDAVVALFGAPTAHEDDPERAVRAALAIRDWAVEQGEHLQVRIAVNTGEALIALDARPETGEAMASGDVVNTAARLQTAAPLNGVLVGEQTRRATAHAIDYREAEAVVAKGKSDPVPAWEALGARARLGVDLTRTVSTPFVGRSRELELLTSALARVREEHAPQLVTLVGVPGIGKSRIVHELFQLVDGEQGLTTWRQGRSLPYGDGVTFWALAEIVKSEAGILESDAPPEAVEKLRTVIARLSRDATEGQWLERHLRPLVGLAEDGSAGAGEVFAAWRRFLEALAEERPVVLVCEDLHWADDVFLEFVDELVDRVVGVPLLVLGTSRPELLQRRPSWGGGKLNALTISLPPLSDEDIAQMVLGLPEQEELEPATREALVGRAGGNPLYAEQYARMLQERGGLDELPSTVHGIIAARLDALAEQEKRLLQDAAVVGKVFWVGSVEAVGEGSRWELEDVLRGLERKEFVARSRTSSVASESEWSFRHGLIRDVAYGQIPRAARADKHRRAASWIESLGRPEDQAEMLAHHYLQALELAEAAGLDTTALGESARSALRDAGDRAASLFSLDAAKRYFEAALRLCPEDGAERAYLLFRRASPLRVFAGELDERLVEASEALAAAGDVEHAVEAEVLLSRGYWMRARLDLADLHGDRALALAATAPASRAAVEALVQQASRMSLRGDLEGGYEAASRAAELATELGWDEGLSSALGWRAPNRLSRGDMGGHEDFARAVELATRCGALGRLAHLLNNQAASLLELGDLQGALASGAESKRVSQQIGVRAGQLWDTGVATFEQYLQGHWDDVAAGCDEFFAMLGPGGTHYLTGQVHTVRGAVRLGRGDRVGALADADAGLQVGHSIDDPQVHFLLLPLCAQVLVLGGQPERAEEVLLEVLGALRQSTHLGFAHVGLAALAATAARLGLTDQLRDALTGVVDVPWTQVARAYARDDAGTAATLLQKIGSVPDEALARLLAAEQALAAGDPERAREHATRAGDLFTVMAAPAHLEEAQRLVAVAGAVIKD